MLKWLASKLGRLVGGIREMATFWTSVFVMLVPIGLAVLIQWPNQYIIAFGMMFIGVVLGVVGLGFTIRDERKAERERGEERDLRKKEYLNNQHEHDELIALLVGTRKKISTPRVIRLIERICELRGDENERDDD